MMFLLNVGENLPGWDSYSYANSGFTNLPGAHHVSMGKWLFHKLKGQDCSLTLLSILAILIEKEKLPSLLADQPIYHQCWIVLATSHLIGGRFISNGGETKARKCQSWLGSARLFLPEPKALVAIGRKTPFTCLKKQSFVLLRFGQPVAPGSQCSSQDGFREKKREPV